MGSQCGDSKSSTWDFLFLPSWAQPWLHRTCNQSQPCHWLNREVRVGLLEERLPTTESSLSKCPCAPLGPLDSLTSVELATLESTQRSLTLWNGSQKRWPPTR